MEELVQMFISLCVVAIIIAVSIGLGVFVFMHLGTIILVLGFLCLVGVLISLFMQK